MRSPAKAIDKAFETYLRSQIEYLKDTFTDVRELQRQLKAEGVELTSEADETTTGPASFTVIDPDGNPILVDQHV